MLNKKYILRDGIYIDPTHHPLPSSDHQDGAAEYLLELLAATSDLSTGSEELARGIRDEATQYHLHPKRADLLRPLAAHLKGKAILEVGSACGALSRYLCECGGEVIALESDERQARVTAARCRDLSNIRVVNDQLRADLADKDSFDIIFLNGMPEHDLPERLKGLLRRDGLLILATENKLGLKYWAGMPEDTTPPYAFGKKELEDLLDTAGYHHREFLYPFPDHKLPDITLKEGAFEAKGLDVLNLLNDSSLLTVESFYRNKLLPDLSNSFLLIASRSPLPRVGEARVLAFSYNSTRKKKYAKENLFIRSEDGTIEVIRRRMYAMPVTPDPFIHQEIRPEKYLPGKLLSRNIPDIVSREGWSVGDLRAWAGEYYHILLCHADRDGMLDGKWLDLTPYNILIQENNDPKIFDQEWSTPEKVPLYFILFRGMVYSFARIAFVAPPAADTPLQVIGLVTTIIRTILPFDNSRIRECTRLEEKYFSSVPLMPGKTFSHGNLKIMAPHAHLSEWAAEKAQALVEKAKELSATEDILLAKGTELEAERKMVQLLEEELLQSKAEAKEYSQLLEDELKVHREMLEDRQTRLAESERSLSWYKRTWEDRSFAGVIKEKLGMALRRRYRHVLIRLLNSRRIQKKYVLLHLLEYMRDHGVRKLFRLYAGEVREKGIGALAHFRQTSLSILRLQQKNEFLPGMVLPDEVQDPEQLREEMAAFTYRPLLSIILPTYNTKPFLLERAVNSVIDQLYPHWEICIADDHSTRNDTLRLLQRYASDPRIHITFLPVNKGISEASNAALEQAGGEYIALLDHDDVLTADALFQVVATLNRKGEADILYSDECKVDEKGALSDYFFKPDWSPELLFNCMYTGHLTLYRKDFLREKVGGFRKEYDFSQDYDLMLRASEKTARILHIPHILYHWGMTEGSASQGGKPYARQTNLAALRDAMKRRRIEADIIELPCANRVKLRFDPVKVSVIVPTDSFDNLKETLEKLAAGTSYPDYEIVVVTHTALIGRMQPLFADLPVVYVPYDLPYNFSDKCNQGALSSSGEVLIFFNDDVRPLQQDWIENTIEYLFVPGVGGVSPKLVYENQTIQYAGMATGVRNLIGTTFHGYPSDSTLYLNFPQLVRNVTLLSGACLAVKRSVFREVGGFDSIHTPSAHSDADLSFKIRSRGLRCVYTPYATLLHIGHLSLAGHEKKQKKIKDKADIFLLRWWTDRLAEDPYFTEPMRRYLYRDSPEPFRLYSPAARQGPADQGDVLVVSHDLSYSGAPIILVEACRIFARNGYFVTVVSEKDGPLRERLLQNGIPVIIDSLALRQHPSFLRFARNFDHIICNTIVTWPVVRQMNGDGNITWWLHEGKVLESFLANRHCRETLEAAEKVVGVSDYSLKYIRKYNPRAQKLRLGYQDIGEKAAHLPDEERSSRIIFCVIASLERRKGQDVLLDALQYIPPAVLGEMEVWFIGRTLDMPMAEELAERSRHLPVRFLGEQDHQECLDLLLRSDIIISPSRDDPFPVVLIEGLCLSKPCIVSSATGLCELIEEGRNGFVFRNEDSRGLAEKIEWCVRNQDALKRIGANARETFEQYLTMAEYEKNVLGLLSFMPDKEQEGRDPVPRFINDDEFSGIENICSRQVVAHFYLKGEGIEIGALHKPLAVAPGVRVRYVDYKSQEENMKRYPELVTAGEAIVPTDIIDDGFLLEKVEDGSQDFVIANHALEHSPDPLGTLEVWLKKLRSSGILFVTIPIAEKCYDKGRPLTTLRHFREDHQHFKAGNKRAVVNTVKSHLWEFITVSGRNIARLNNVTIPAAREKELYNQLVTALNDTIPETCSYEELINAHVIQINRVYDIHYHTFSPTSYESFLQDFCREQGATLESVLKNGSGECIGVIRKN